jgi:hypothetical protein
VAVYPDTSQGVKVWETPYGRITGCGSETDWKYEFFVQDWGDNEKIVNNEVINTYIGPADFDFSVSIRFPRSDLPLISERLRQAQRERGLKR